MQIYYRLIAQKASLRCRLRGVVGYIFPELERYFTDITAKSMIIILENFPFPIEIKKMEKSDFVSFSLGRNPRLSRKRAEEIFKLANFSVGITGEEKVIFLEIELLLDELKRIEKSIGKINSEAKAIVEERGG